MTKKWMVGAIVALVIVAVRVVKVCAFGFYHAHGEGFVESKVVLKKMGGAYHGWSDQLGYGIRIPGTKFTQANGVPARIMRDTVRPPCRCGSL